MNKNKILLSALIILSSGLLLSACGSKKKQVDNAKPTEAPRLIELSLADRPYISLVPRADGHELKMSISNIPDKFEKIEYELIYTAVDQGNEMEKGLGDTITLNGSSIERNLLLGTESCTHGCKYKYDEGVTGGTLSLTMITKDGQMSTYQSPFVLASAADLKKTGRLSLDSENFSIGVSPSNKSEFFILIKNYGVPSGSQAQAAFSVFSSANGKGKITDTTPADLKKTDNTTISGDYLLN